MRGFLIILALIALLGGIAFTIRAHDKSISNGLYFVAGLMALVLIGIIIAGELSN